MDLSLDLVKTIQDEDNVAILDAESDEEEQSKSRPKKKTKKGEHPSEFSEGFQFDEEALEKDTFVTSLNMNARGHSRPSTLQEKIALVRQKRKKPDGEMEGADDSEDEVKRLKPSDEVDDEVDAEEVDEPGKAAQALLDENVMSVEDTLRVIEKKGKKKAAKEEDHFFEDPPPLIHRSSFQELNLSRPLVKAMNSIGWDTPTPIQCAAVPLALKGRDLCGCAVTGSGKTGAFLLPCIERLLYRPSRATRVLILTPTRELAIQISQTAERLARFIDPPLECCLATGGLDIRTQEAALRKQPDIVVATPGRLIDLLHNGPGFHLGDLEVLVLDEADRMLDEFFAAQMGEVLRLCPPSRQTLLFSATMTEQVRELAAVALRKPVRLFVDPAASLAPRLRQEVVRVRHEADREAILAALLARSFKQRTVIFVQTRKQCHRLRILLGLLGLTVQELHGEMSQAQRMEALKQFTEGDVAALLATDLASRGLDIPHVATVINFTLPGTLKHYVHRVGRTARAGLAGLAVSLVGQQERPLLRAIIKNADQPSLRTIPPDVLARFRQAVEQLQSHVEEVFLLEKTEKEMGIAERQVEIASKRLKGEPRPAARTWFQTHRERKQEESRQLLRQPEEKKKRGKKRTQPSAEDRSMHEVQKAMEFQVRTAKRSSKPARLRACPDDQPRAGSAQRKGGKQKGRPKSSFERELTDTSRRAVKEFRHASSNKQSKRQDPPHKRRR